MRGRRTKSASRPAHERALAAFTLPRLVLLFAGVVLLSIVLGALAFSARKHNSLAKFKADLRAQGEKLTFEELIPPDIAESGLLWTQLVTATSSLGQHGLSPGALDLTVYTGPSRARVAWKQDSPPWIPSAGYGAVRSWEEYDAEIAAAGETLATLRQVLKNPPTHWASRASRRTGVIPNFVPLRLSAQWLVGEAIGNLRQGKLEQALQDIEGVAGCAQANREDYTLVSQMIRVAVTGLGLSASWEALQAPGWTEPQLERLQKAWENVDLIDAIETGFIAVRAEGTEL